MKYMIMLFGDEAGWENLTEDEWAAEMQKHEDFSAWCEASGISLSHGEELELSPTASTFHADGRETDGPFLEIKEQLGGYYIIETDSIDLAKEAARRAPNYGATELRPITNREA